MYPRRFLRTAWVPVLLLFVSLAAPAVAAEGSIDHVEPGESSVSLLFSVPNESGAAAPDPSSVTVTVNGEPVEATAQLASEAVDVETVRRTAVLAIDVSRSMNGERFEKAKAAARDFLSTVSDDVYVGIVAFAGEVTTVQEPSRNRAESVGVLNTLSLSLETRLYDGVQEALAASGTEGQRTVLVLSDGRDTSDTALDDTVAAVEDSGARVDVVALAQAPAGRSALEAIAGAGRGEVLAADDPDALTAVFSAEAQALARQLLVTADLPADLDSQEGTLAVSVKTGAETFTSQAFVTLSTVSMTKGTPAATPDAPLPGFQVSRTVMFAGLGAAGVATLLLLLAAFGVLTPAKESSVEERVAAYTRPARGAHAGLRSGPVSSSAGIAQTALGAAERALSTNAGVAASIGSRLEAAGMSLKPAEWVLIHAGIAVGASMVGMLLGGGSFVLLLVFLALGMALPWVFLGMKKSRRLRAFDAQLAETLQLISGGLSAGLSLAQSVDTVVRQGSDPMRSEFKRALVETRLGVSIEDALESTAERMESKDFKWVVIAVRVQREVGGNLAEVLNQVADTIRERGYLRRQVKSLSAEGVLSAWILGALPPAMFVYFLMVRREYMDPMFTEPLGWAMLGGGAVMMAIGAFWLKQLVKLEV